MEAVTVTLKELSSIVKMSEATIRRRVRERKAGKGDFPLPVSGGGDGRKCLWRREDIENWRNEDAPKPVHVEGIVGKRIKKSIRNQLIDMGMKLDKE